MRAKGTCKGVFPCACGFDIPVFVCKGETLPDTLDCCVCGAEYLLNWQEIHVDKVEELKAKGEILLEMEG